MCTCINKTHTNQPFDHCPLSDMERRVLMDNMHIKIHGSDPIDSIIELYLKMQGIGKETNTHEDTNRVEKK